MEQAFDNAAEMIGGKTGKGIEVTKDVIEWALLRDEDRRLSGLQEKYGPGYYIHKIPAHVPEGITLRYTHVGRDTTIHLDRSQLEKPAKAFVEIPKITWTQTVPGAVRRASLEGLVFEFTMLPSGERPKTPTNPQDATGPIYSIEMIYGEWERLRDKNNSLRIAKNGISEARSERGSLMDIGKLVEPPVVRNVYRKMQKGKINGGVIIISPNIIIYDSDVFARRGLERKNIQFLEDITGKWIAIGMNANSKEYRNKKREEEPGNQQPEIFYIGFDIVEIEENSASFTYRPDNEFHTVRILKKQKMGEAYLITTDKNEINPLVVVPNPDGTISLTAKENFATYRRRAP